MAVSVDMVEKRAYIHCIAVDKFEVPGESRFHTAQYASKRSPHLIESNQKPLKKTNSRVCRDPSWARGGGRSNRPAPSIRKQLIYLQCRVFVPPNLPSHRSRFYCLFGIHPNTAGRIQFSGKAGKHMRSWKSATTLILAGALCITPIWAQANANAAPPRQGPQQGPGPGMVNYIEGQVSLGGQPLNQNSIGSAALRPGQALATQNGRAEVLLSPGALLRMDNNSAVLMDAAALENTEVAIQGGRAMVEADQVLPADHIAIHEGPATVLLVKNGLYDFDAAHNQFRVFDGRAEVTLAGKTFTVQGGHQFDLNAAKLKARGFDKKADEDAFYRWGSLRSSYLAEANADAARGFSQGYYGGGGPGPGYGPGYSYGPASYYGGAGYPDWFWDPYFDAYTWLPWDGIFYSPFGFGFYSPGFAFYAPRYGYGFGGGYHSFGPGYRPSVAAHAGSSGQVAGTAFHGSGFGGGGVRTSSGFAGGGFRGGSGFAGGGGFHGGGGFAGGGGGRR